MKIKLQRSFLFQALSFAIVAAILLGTVGMLLQAYISAAR